jgi:RNA polymerase sigma-70 factor (ECF subfamily)
MSGEPRESGLQGLRVRFIEPAKPAVEALEDAETARLVTQVQMGDENAFVRLYTLYFDRVFAHLRVALRDHHEAEDATQQVFLKILESLPDYEQRERPFRNWLFAIVRNHAISLLRKSGRVEAVEPERVERYREREGAAGEEPLLTALAWITDSDLTVFVDRLPLPQRQVLALRYLFDLPYAEIAQVLDRSTEDVKTLHFRAVRFLRARLAAIGRAASGPAQLSAWPVFKQAEVLRHRRFMLH